MPAAATLKLFCRGINDVVNDNEAETSARWRIQESVKERISCSG